MSNELCKKCSRTDRCPYTLDARVGFYLRGVCGFGGVSLVEKVVVEKHKVNPLKASKKGQK